MLKPDIVVVDYLMPSKDGADVIKEVRTVHESIQFIMISQVSDKSMIEEAYSQGLSFFIQKPINKMEVNVVLTNIEERLKTDAKLKQIYSVLGDWKNTEQEDEETPQAKSVGQRAVSAPKGFHSQIRNSGGGKSLPESSRRFFEPCFRTDFSQVRIHTGALAEQAARRIRSKAFTLRKNIFFGSGQYSPCTKKGRRVGFFCEPTNTNHP